MSRWSHVEKQVNEMVDLSWAAGVLDVRGHWAVSSRKGKPHQLQPRITARFTGQTRATMADELVRILGGRSAVAPQQPLARIWTISGAKACLDATRRVEPFLVARARRAQLHYELCFRIVSYSPDRFEDRGLDQLEIDERLKLVEAISRL